jgi:hypothetical protein
VDGNWHPHCQSKFEFFKDKIALQSLMPTENEAVGYEECGQRPFGGNQDYRDA